MHVDVFCIHFEFVYMALLFLFVASLLPFYFIDVHMQDSPELKISYVAEMTTC